MSFSFVNDDASSSEYEPPDAIINFMGRRNCHAEQQQKLAAGAEGGSSGASQTYANYHVEQYAVAVADFSSQYGIDYSISYTAPNIIGRPMKFPLYGDYPETYAMRTYGDWWHRAPSGTYEIQTQNVPKVAADDFIVLFFEDYIIPSEVAIFETFNPGAVVRIWAFTIAKTWVCLWETNDFTTRQPYNVKQARRFSPTLKKLQLPVKTLRLEFNHKYLDYYTEIDGVLLSGYSVNVRHMQQLMEDFWAQKRKGSILRKLRTMQFRPCRNDYEEQLKNFLNNDFNNFLSEHQQQQQQQQPENSETTAEVETIQQLATLTKEQENISHILLSDLPFEILLKIFGYLDLLTLFRVGQVSRTFYDISTHPLLYCEINLKPYWHVANSELICTLARRATQMRKLDLSWCGLFNTISPTEFKKFITQRGDNLTHLRLNSCKLLNASCIESLAIVCDNLTELSLRNCTTDPPLLNFSCLANLKNLERLDLFQTSFESELLLAMLEGNRKLKHLNLAFCGVTVNMDNVAEHIGTYNKQLLSLDMWKSHSLSAAGLFSLAQCHDLLELDVGWCLREATLGESLHTLLLNCPKLKKLFMSTVRGITERDLIHISELCQNLEQLDLMGILSITMERIHDILRRCPKLELLDVSFCDNILERDMPLLSQWSRKFNVQIKCSHVPYDSR